MFFCYVKGETFAISTDKCILHFNFSNMKDEKMMANYMEAAITLLRSHIPQNALLLQTVMPGK